MMLVSVVHNYVVEKNVIAFINCYSYWYSIKYESDLVEKSQLNKYHNITRNFAKKKKTILT